jgi:hypothetical protein
MTASMIAPPAGERFGTIVIVILEDEDDQYEMACQRYGDILSRMGYSPEFRRCRGKNELAPMLKAHPHMVVCDLSLSPTKENYEGLEAIADYKSQFPHVAFIGNTRRHVSTDQFGAKYPNPDMMVSKKYLNIDDGYLDYLVKRLGNLLHRCPKIEIDVEGGLTKALEGFIGSKPRLDDIAALVSQVAFVGHGSDPVTQVQRVILKPMDGEYSGSAVFEMSVYSANGKFGVPAVLKVSKSEAAEAEYANYNRYVKWLLPYLWRVDVLGYGSTGAFGAVCYSFVLAGGREPRPMTRAIEEGSGKATDDMTKTIFDPQSQMWYSHRRVGVGDIAFNHYASKRYFNNPRHQSEATNRLVERTREFCRKGGTYFESQKEDNRVQINEVMYSLPDFLLFTQRWGAYAECICHGDLNSNNVMYEEGRGAVAFIDFQRTGYAHVFWDFVVFESSLRIYFPPTVKRSHADVEQFISMETSLCTAGWEDRCAFEERYLREVLKVRQAAKANFPDEPFRNYVIGSLVQSLRLLRLLKPDEERTLRLLGTIYASVKYLEKQRSESPLIHQPAGGSKIAVASNGNE